MKIELSNIPFMSNEISADNHIDFPEGIHCICCRDSSILQQLFLYLTASASPASGHVRFLNYDVCALGEAYKNHLSYFRRYPLFPGTFPLFPYLTYTSLLQRLPANSAKQKAETLIRKMNLTADRNSLLSTLDFNTLNRIDLYQTLLSEAPIFILDDKYFPALNSSDYKEMQSILSAAVESKIIIILHQLNTHKIRSKEYLSIEKEDPLPDLPHTTYVFE